MELRRSTALGVRHVRVFLFSDPLLLFLSLITIIRMQLGHYGDSPHEGMIVLYRNTHLQPNPQ